MITKIYEQECVTLDYDPYVPCVIATSLKFMMLEEFKAHLNFGLDFMKEKIKETKRMMWLPDTRLAGAFDAEGVKWVAEDWTPRAVAAGIKHTGFVMPDSEWAMMSLDDYRDIIKDHQEKEEMITAYFKDLESAKKWFRDMNN